MTKPQNGSSTKTSPDTVPHEIFDEFRFRSFSIRKPIAFAYLLSTLYNVMFFMQFMSTPYVVKELGISDSDYGYVQTLFGLLQVVGGPVFGYIIQKFGIRAGLYLCYGSTLLSSILLYGSYDLLSLTISRLPVFFMHGQQGHQTLLSLLTNPGKERTNAFGRMGLTFGIGFILTPIMSIISKYFMGSRGPMLTGALLSILPFLIMEKYIDRREYEHDPDGESAKKDVGGAMSWNSVVTVMKKPGTGNIMFKKNAAVVPMLLIFSILQMYMIESFNASQEVNSLIQMLVGVCIMFSNGFGVIWLRKKFDEQSLLIIGNVSFIIAFILFQFFNSLWMIAVIMPFASMGMSLVSTVCDSMLTSLVAEEEQGVVLGVSTGLNSFVRTFAPAVSGVILEQYGFVSFGFIGLMGTVAGLAACIMAPVDTGLLRKERSHSMGEEKKQE